MKSANIEVIAFDSFTERHLGIFDRIIIDFYSNENVISIRIMLKCRFVKSILIKITYLYVEYLLVL